METLPNLRKEFEHEFSLTRQFFDHFPDGINHYTPHEKSMKLIPLAIHIAEIFGWPAFIMNTEKLDFAAGDYQPSVINTGTELRQMLEEAYTKSIETLAQMTEESLAGSWTMHMGEKLLASFTKYEAIRHALNQITHHRAQLGIYYRLNDISVPASYGPSADDETFS